MTELFFPDGSVRRATLLAREQGQRMAALPCALVTRSLCLDPVRKFGAMTAYELLGASVLLDGLTQRGYELSQDGVDIENCQLRIAGRTSLAPKGHLKGQ